MVKLILPNWRRNDNPFLNHSFPYHDGLTNEEMKSLWGIFKRNFTAPEERKAKVTFYVPLDEDYITEFMYLKNPKPQIDHIDSNTNTVYYKGLQFVLTGY